MLFRSEKRPVPGNDIHTVSSAPKRVLSVFMSMVLAITLAPFPAYAAPADAGDGVIPAEEQSGSTQVAAGEHAVDASMPGASAAEQATTEPAPSSDASAAEPEPATSPATAAEAEPTTAPATAAAPASDASADEPASAPAATAAEAASDVSAGEPAPASGASADEPTPAPATEAATTPAAPAAAPAPVIDLD